jgi:hypothetical protein
MLAQSVLDGYNVSLTPKPRLDVDVRSASLPMARLVLVNRGQWKVARCVP